MHFLFLFVILACVGCKGPGSFGAGRLEMVPDAVRSPESWASVSDDSLVFVDADIKGLEYLQSSKSNTVITLDPGVSPFSQISDHLKSHPGVKCIAIVSEGAPGSLLLKRQAVTVSSLLDYRSELMSWACLMAPGADILLYGCRIAEGNDGEHFVKKLSEFTGLDVAASTTFTGASALGGDTELEFTCGEVTSHLASLEVQLGKLPALLGYTDKPVVSNPGAQSSNEDANYLMSSGVVVSDPSSDRMEVVVKVLSGNGLLRDGTVTAAELSAQGARAGLNNFLSGLAFEPAAHWNGSVSIEVSVTSDFNARTAGNTTTFTFPLTITPVNDAPVASGSSSLPAVNEDTASPAGDTITALFAARFDDSIDTVASGSSSNTLAGVAIVANTVNAAQGQWQYFDGSTWTNVGTRTASSTLLIPVNDKLRFLPAANWFGTPSNLTVRLIDNSSGAVVRGTGPDLSIAANSGGTRVYSAASVALSTSVSAVNDVPVTANFNLSVIKNQVSSFVLTSTDVDGGSNTTTDAVVTGYQVMTLPTNGTLRHGTTVISVAATSITAAQAANMSYTPNSNYEGADSFTFRAVDAAAAVSVTSTASITVTPFNEPPVVTLPGPATVVEDTSLNLIGTASVADPDAGGARVRATVTGTNGTVTLSQLTGLFNAASGGTAITNSTFTTLTFFGTTTSINGALTGLRYTPTANYFGAATITVTVNDLANTGLPAKEDSKSIAVTVTNVPDAPLTGAATLAAVNEDTLSPAGASISSLLTAYFDADTNLLAGIAVSANTADPTTQGRWQYSLNSGATWSNIGTVSPSSALLLSASSLLRFTPVANYGGTPPSIAIHAADNSGSRSYTASSGSRQTLNLSPAASDFDAVGNTLSTNIIAVDDPFVVVNSKILGAPEGDTALLTSSILSITDAEANPSEIVYTILASGTSLNQGIFQKDTTGTGAWTLMGTSSTFTQANINSGRIRYVHNGDEPTPSTPETLAYSVTDLKNGSGTSANRVLTIEVTPVNDRPALYLPGNTTPAPASQLLTGTVELGTSLTFSADNVVILDPDNTNEQLVIRIESLPTRGVLTINGAAVGVGSLVHYEEILMDGALVYTPTSTLGADVFTVSLRDGAGGLVGAVGGLPTTPLSVNLMVIPRNFVPVVLNNAFTILERDINIPVPVSVSDEETATADLVVRILSLPNPAEAELYYNTTKITQTMIDAGYQLAGNALTPLKITHISANRLNPPDVSFRIRVTDKGNPVNSNIKVSEKDVLVTVRPVDDDPTLTVRNMTLSAAGATQVLNASILNLDSADVDTTDDMLLFRVTDIPDSGFIRLSGVPLGVGGTFTQADVDAGRVSYAHNGYASTTDSFKVTLRDQGFNIRYNRPGGVYANTITTILQEFTVNISIPSGGSNPGSGTTGPTGSGVVQQVFQDILFTNKRTATYNTTLNVPQSQLLANDGGVLPLTITAVTMTGGNGTVSLDPGTGNVIFVPALNFSGTTSFNYTLRDGDNRTATGAVIVYVLNVDYPPRIINNTGATVSEGQRVAITSAMLETADDEQTSEDLVYVLLSLPAHGALYLDQTPSNGLGDASILRVEDTLTQKDINDGKVFYRHNGTENFTSGFTFRVSDGSNPSVPVVPAAAAAFAITITPVNDSPDADTEGFMLNEGATYMLSSTNFSATDVEGNTVSYSIQSGGLPINGSFQKNNAGTWTALTVGGAFTNNDLSTGKMRYVHNGGETLFDLITVTLNDGMSALASWTPQAGSGTLAWNTLVSSGDGTLQLGLASGHAIQVSNNEGVTWSSTSSGGLSWVSAASSYTGGRLAAVAPGSPIVTSIDRGVTWVARPSGSLQWSDIAMSNDGNVLTATVNGGKIYTSTDGGANWAAYSDSTTRAWNSIAISDDGVKMVASVDDGDLFLSLDAGQSWAAMSSAGQREWTSVSVSDDFERIVAVANNGRVYVSEDLGLSWQVEGSIRNWTDVAVSADSLTVVGTANDGVYLSRDGGETWANQGISGITGWSATAMAEDGSLLLAAAPSNVIHTGPGVQGASIVTAGIPIEVVPLNDDPFISVNQPMTVAEGGSGTIRGTAVGPAPVPAPVLLLGEDPDNSDTQVQFRLVTYPVHGLLKLNGELLGVGSRITLADVKANLLTYEHDGFESSTDDFDVRISDGGGGFEELGTFVINITRINDAPNVVAPPTVIAIESDATAIEGVAVSDPDSVVLGVTNQSFGPMRVTLAASGGVVNVPTTGLSVTGNGTTNVRLEGTLGALNSALGLLTYTAGAVASVTGADTLAITVSDLGNTGTGNVLTNSTTVAITLWGVNNGPVVTVPPAQSVSEDQPLTFSSGQGNLISFTDGDLGGADARMTISVTKGTLDLFTTAGLTSVTGNGTSTITLVGSRDELLAAINGLKYTGNVDYFGADTLTVTVNDLGNSGTLNTPQSDTKMVAITVNPVNDIPVVANLDFDVNEDGVLTLALESTDVDTGTNATTNAAVTHYFIELTPDFVGALRTSNNVLLTTTGSVTPAGFTAMSARRHVITVAQATNMTYTPPADFNSDLPTGSTPDWRSAFLFQAIDILGANYVSSSKSGLARAEMVINAVNDAPVLAGGGDSVTYTEGAGFNALGTPVVLNATGDVTVSDVEIITQGVDNFGSATVTVRRTSGAQSTDRFGVRQNGGISLSGSNIVIDGSARATITNDSAAGMLVVTFAAAANQAHVQTILRNISFASTADNEVGIKTISMVFNDGNAGDQGSGGVLNANTISFSVNIVNSNDSPAFATNGLVTVAEDSVAPTGVSVDSIMGSRFTDPDPVALAAAQFSGVAITRDASDRVTEGRWQYSTDSANWHDVSPSGLPAVHPSATNALLLEKTSFLRFIPVANFNDRLGRINDPAGALTVVAVDDSGSRAWTSNAVRQFADTVTGWTDISDLGAASSKLINISVTQVNDAPVIADLDDDSTFIEAVGVNVAGPAVLLDNPAAPAALADIDLILRNETTFNGSRLVVRAQTLDTNDFFLPQIAGGITLSGTSTFPGPGVRLYDNGSIIRFNDITVAALTHNSSGTGQLIITFNQDASQAAVEALLRNLTYSNKNPAVTLAIKPIDITFFDGNGSSNNIQGTGGDLSDTVTVNMTMTPRNDSPRFSQGRTITTNEEATTPAGSFYSLLSAYFQDPDNLTVPTNNDLDGIAISAFNNAGLGQWQVSLDGTNWVPVTTINTSVSGLAATKALLLGRNTQVRFVPNANANTAGATKPSLTLHAVEAAIPPGSINDGVGQAAGPITFTSDLNSPLTYDTTANPEESRVGGSTVVVDTQINAFNDVPAFATGSAYTGTLIESALNNIGTTPTQQLLNGVSITDIDPSTTATLIPTVFGAGTITVAITAGVTGDRFTISGTPVGITSQSGGTNGSNLVINLATTATFAQVNAILEALRYEHTTDAPPSGTRSYTVSLSDGNNSTGGANAGGPAALTAQLGGDITITGVNDEPTSVATSLNPTFVENAAAPSADNLNGNIFGPTVVNVTGDGQLITEVRYTITNIEDGTKEFLRLDGNLVALNNGNTITGSSISGGNITVSVTGSTATVSYLKPSGLTASQTQALTGGLRYHSTLDAFTTTTRVVNLAFMQDNGGTTNGGDDTTTDFTVAPSNMTASTVTIAPRNDAPVLTATAANPTVTEQAGKDTGTDSALLFTVAALADVDFTNASLGGGRVVLNFSVAYDPGDRIFIATDTALATNAVRVDGSNIQISLNGITWTTVGTVNATNNGVGKELTINLNADATEDNIGHVLTALRYRSAADNPSQNGTLPSRFYGLTVTDGNNNNLAGGLTELASGNIGGTITIVTVNDTALADLNGAGAGENHSVTWNEVANGTHVSVTTTPAALLSDPDNSNLTRMRFTLTGLLNGNSEVLRIGGTDFLLGTNYSNVDVGAFLVSYDASTGLFFIIPDGASVASVASYQTLLRGITYNNTTDHPTAGGRDFTLILTDAGPANAGVDSLDSPSSVFTVNVVPTNDQPVITDLNAVVFMENAINATAATIDATITATDIDSPDYNTGSLVVSGLVAGQDVVSLPTGVTGVVGAVQINGGNVEYHDGNAWIVIGTHSGGSGSNYVINFNADANRERAERVLENLTFANTSHNPTLVRTLTYTLNDGDGNPTQPATVLVTIKLENDAPTLAGTTGLSYTEQGVAAAFVTGSSVTDPDVPTNFFNGGTRVGSLTVAFDGYSTGDLIAVANLGTGVGQIGVSGSNIRFAETTFATFTGGNAADLVITFTSNTATPTAVAALMNALRYSSTSDDPTVNTTDPSRAFTVTFNDGANVKDNDSTTLALTSTLNGTITITPVNDVPVISPALAAVSFTEKSAALTVDSTVTVSDLDDTQINGGSVSITTGRLSGDTLAVVTAGTSVTANYDAVTGVLSLTGLDTLANYRLVLQSLTFVTANNDPTDNGTKTTRLLTYSLTDANSDGAGAQTGTATKTINIVPLNDKPDVTAAGVLAYTENSPAAVIDATITIADLDDTQITGAVVNISSGLTTGDVLAVTSQNGISGSYNPITGWLTLSGTATLAHYEAALKSVTFLSTSDYPTQNSTSRTVSWRVTDANSDLAGAQTSVAVTSTINITEVNDPPVNTVPATISVNENATFAFTGLNSVSANDPELNLASVRLTVSQGVLSVNLSGGATILAGVNGSATLTLTGTRAQINAALATLTYAGTLHFNGSDILTIVSTDADASPLSDTDTIAITVNPVNSAPQGTDGAIVVVMNGTYLLKPTDFGFSDPNDTPANLFNRVRITTLPDPSKGVLTLNGNAVTAGSFVTVAALDAGLLVYTPPVDQNGFAYTSFTFQVEDNGGTANGGVNLDATPNTMLVHVGGIVPQTLCFVAPLEAPVTQVLPLFGNATSGLNVIYSVLSGPGTINGNLLTFTAAGEVVVRASQPGDLTYRPAPTVDQTIKAVSLTIPLSVSDGWNLAYGTGVASKGQAVAMELSGQLAQHIAVTGYVTGAGGKRDLYVTKRVAATGVEVWSKSYDGTAGLDDEGAAVKFDSAGNVVVIGQETNASGNTDIVVLKFAAANGTQLWKRAFKGSDGTTDTGADSVGSYDVVNRVLKGRKNLAIGPSNEVIVGGFVTNSTAGRDLVVIKYDTNGTKVWHNTYDGAGGIDFANAVAVDGVGNVYAAGGSRTGAAMSSLDGVTLKYNVSGNLVWTDRYDNGRPDEITSLMLDRDNNPVVSGYTQQNTFNMFVVRYNQNVDPGAPLQTTIIWESIFDNPAYQSSESVWDMGMVFGRDVMLTGTSYPLNGVFNGYTMRFKGTCVEGARWDREYGDVSGGQDQMVAMGADYFGSPVVVGYTQAAGGRFAIQITKYDSEPGGMLWTKRYQSADGDSEPTAVAVDPSGNVFVIGYTTTSGGATKVLVQNYSPYSNPSRAAQTITFANPGAQLSGTTLALSATSDRGLPLTYTVVSGPATVLGNSLVLRGSGNVTVRASQAGSGDYLPAAPVQVTFSVSKSSQTISFNLPAKIYQVNGAWEKFPLTGVSTSDLAVSYEVVSGPASINEGILQLSGAGLVTIRASQIGDSSYSAAVSVVRSVVGEVLGTFSILNDFHVNWRDRSLLDVTDNTSFASGQGVSLALGMTGRDATAGYIAGFVNGANGKDLYLTKYTHNIITSSAVQSWARRINGSASGDDEAAAVAVDASGNVIVAGYVTTSTGRDLYVAKYNSDGGNGAAGSTTPIWEYTYNGSANGTDMAISLALQGTTHVVVGGCAASSGAGDDFFAAKLNAGDGSVVWQRTHNRSTTTSDIPSKVAVGSDGAVVLTGISSSNAWTVKLDSAAGNLTWQKVYNFANKPDGIRGLALDGANNVIVSGYSQGSNYDMYTAKYQADTGAIVWEHRYNGSFNSSDAAWDVIVDRQGNVLVTGTAYRAAGVRDGLTIKYNGLNGAVVWAKRPFGNVGTTSANDENFSIALDGIGNLVVVGYTVNSVTGTDYYVARHLNNGGVTDGNVVGERVFDGYYQGTDVIYQARMDPNGSIWMVGYTTTTRGVQQPLVVRLAPGP